MPKPLNMIRQTLMCGASWPLLVHAELRILQAAIDAKAQLHRDELLAMEQIRRQQ